MPSCPNCGKEVSEHTKFCPDCGQRLKEGFTLEERQKYIEELKASIDERKPAEKTKMTKGKLAGIIIASIIVVFVVIGVATSGESAERNPEDILPLSVTGFELLKKSGWRTGSYSIAYSIFVPTIGSKFYSKVENLQTNVFKYRHEKTARYAALGYTRISTTQEEIEEIVVDHSKATLCYNKDDGVASAAWQDGKLVVLTVAIPPSEASTFDEQVLKDAAIEGARATAENL